MVHVPPFPHALLSQLILLAGAGDIGATTAIAATLAAEWLRSKGLVDEADALVDGTVRTLSPDQLSRVCLAVASHVVLAEDDAGTVTVSVSHAAADDA